MGSVKYLHGKEKKQETLYQITNHRQMLKYLNITNIHEEI